MTSIESRCLWVVFSLALLVRVGFVLMLQDGFYFLDSVEYSSAAVSLLTQGELGEIYQRPPAYPVFLALIYLLFGESILAVRLVESAMGALLSVLIAMIATRISGQAVGMLAGTLWSIYPLGIFIAGLVYPATLMTFLLACGVLCLLPYAERQFSPLRVFITGVVWGVATLTIPITLSTLLAVSLWLLYWAGSKRFSLISLLVAGAALVVVPWIIRDFHVYGDLVVVEPRATGHLPSVANRNTGAVENSFTALLKQPEVLAGHFGDQFKNFWTIYPDPITDAELRTKYHEMDPRVVRATIFSSNTLANFVTVLTTGPLFFFAAIGAFGMLLEQSRRRELSFLLAVIFSFAVGYSIFLGKMRYRIPIEPYIVILSAYGLHLAYSVVARSLFVGSLHRCKNMRIPGLV